ASVRTALFDKTGTLTRGRPVLVDVLPADGHDASELLALTASAEQYSSHVLAAGVLAAARERDLPILSAEHASEEATNGVRARIGGREVVVGKRAYITSITGPFETAEVRAGQAAAYVAIDGRFAGTVLLADRVREESPPVIDWMQKQGFQTTMMLTGDAEATARHIAAEVGIGQVHADLLPRDKVHLAATAQPRPVMMVGDGVNDAPVLATADVGLAMGVAGSTAAGQAADGVILRDSLRPVADAVAISRHTVAVAKTAIWIGISLSIGLMLTATTGIIPAVAGALLQEVVDLAAILYALLALRPPRSLRQLRHQMEGVAEQGQSREGGEELNSGAARDGVREHATRT
ncbi:MAG: HAD-IC family P-type ATPase, partial [Brachybacterium sp.]|nr:HAD-IC family P-type ATPase [Brachybacterium sp.]